MRMFMFLLVLEQISFVRSAMASQNLLPVKNSVAPTPENFCQGLKNVFAITKQNLTEEAALLCPSSIPSALFRSILGSAFEGLGEPSITSINVQENSDTKTSQLTMAYAFKLNKSPVDILLGEEKHVSVPYSKSPLSITTKFLKPPVNLGDADTSFLVEQRTIVDAQVKFDDVSIHNLSLYRLFSGNFDFFMAARTLKEATEQFKKSVVLRGVMRDASNPNASISISLLNFVMNSRDQHDRLVQAFTDFVVSDLKALYLEQAK